IVKNLGAAARNRIQSSVAQAGNRIAHAQIAVLGNRQNFRSGIAVEVDFRKALFDSAQHALVPVDLEIGMQAALHQHAGAAELDGFADFLVDSVEIEDVAFFSRWHLQRTVESAERAMFGSESGVITVEA